MIIPFFGDGYPNGYEACSDVRRVTGHGAMIVQHKWGSTAPSKPCVWRERLKLDVDRLMPVSR